MKVYPIINHVSFLTTYLQYLASHKGVMDETQLYDTEIGSRLFNSSIVTYDGTGILLNLPFNFLFDKYIKEVHSKLFGGPVVRNLRELVKLLELQSYTDVKGQLERTVSNFIRHYQLKPVTTLNNTTDISISFVLIEELLETASKVGEETDYPALITDIVCDFMEERHSGVEMDIYACLGKHPVTELVGYEPLVREVTRFLSNRKPSEFVSYIYNYPLPDLLRRLIDEFTFKAVKHEQTPIQYKDTQFYVIPDKDMKPLFTAINLSLGSPGIRNFKQWLNGEYHGIVEIPNDPNGFTFSYALFWNRKDFLESFWYNLHLFNLPACMFEVKVDKEKHTCAVKFKDPLTELKWSAIKI